MGICECILNEDKHNFEILPCVNYNKKEKNKIKDTKQFSKNNTKGNSSFEERKNMSNNDKIYDLFKKYEHSESNNKQILFKNFNTKESKTNELLFDEDSNIDICLNKSLMQTDYYQLSWNIFEIINKIRIDIYGNKSFFTQEQFNIICKKAKGDFVLWNEKIYLCCSDYLMNIESGINDSYRIKKCSSERISERLTGKFKCSEFSINGKYTAKELVIQLIKENDNRITELFCENYYSGAVCVIESKEYEMRTIIYYVNKI